jgi:hypothetical protein
MAAVLVSFKDNDFFFFELSDSFVLSTKTEVIGKAFRSNCPSRRRRLAKRASARWELQREAQRGHFACPVSFGFKPGASRVEGQSFASQEQGYKLPLCENKLTCLLPRNMVQVS